MAPKGNPMGSRRGTGAAQEGLKPTGRGAALELFFILTELLIFILMKLISIHMELFILTPMKLLIVTPMDLPVSVPTELLLLLPRSSKAMGVVLGGRVSPVEHGDFLVFAQIQLFPEQTQAGPAWGAMAWPDGPQ